MTIHRYGVLDADGVKVNTITADDKLIGSAWYPGYGVKLIDEGVMEPDPPKPPVPTKPESWDTVLPKLAEPMQNGDRIDFRTGEVTKKPPPEPEPEPGVIEVIGAVKP